MQAPHGWPVRTFLPTGYEPNYPYPLLVFFHGHGGSEEQILRLAPRLSRRNYICIGLRGPHDARLRARRPHGYTWGSDGSPTRWSRTTSSAPSSRRGAAITSTPSASTWPASAKGPALAYRLGLTFPERFGGVISLNGAMPRRGGPLLRLPEVRQLRVLIGHGIANAVVPLEPGPRRLPPALHRRPRGPHAHLPRHPPPPSRHAARHQPLDHGHVQSMAAVPPASRRVSASSLQ